MPHREILFLCAVFCVCAQFEGGRARFYFPVNFHESVVSLYKGTFSPYGAILRRQRLRPFFLVCARIFIRCEFAQEASAPMVYDLGSDMSVSAEHL